MIDLSDHEIIGEMTRFGWRERDALAIGAALSSAEADARYVPDRFCGLILSYFAAARHLQLAGTFVRWAAEVGGAQWKWLVTGHGEVNAEDLIEIAEAHGFATRWRPAPSVARANLKPSPSREAVHGNP